MKNTSLFLRKGFTLVELMIVIAIIGILAAVLYPSMAGYFERARDTNRAAAMQQVNLGLATYFTDAESYPGENNVTCLNAVENQLTGKATTGGSGQPQTQRGTIYMKSLPKDPQSTNIVADCTTPGSYSYKKISNNAGGGIGTSYKAAARVEIKQNGNMLNNKYKEATTTSAVTENIKSKKDMTTATIAANDYAIIATTAQ